MATIRKSVARDTDTGIIPRHHTDRHLPDSAQPLYHYKPTGGLVDHRLLLLVTLDVSRMGLLHVAGLRFDSEWELVEADLQNIGPDCWTEREISSDGQMLALNERSSTGTIESDSAGVCSRCSASPNLIRVRGFLAG